MNELTLVPAGAGAGKTHKIKTTLARWVAEGLVKPERILAVTYTEAAASELRQRIRSSLLDAGLVEAALSVERAYITTIHGLGLRILSEYALANGSSPAPRLLSDPECDLLMRMEIARSEALQAISGNLARYGYTGNAQMGTTAEDELRAKIFATIGTLRSLGDRGSWPGLAEQASTAVAATFGDTAGQSDALAEKLHCAVQDMLQAFPDGIADTADNDTARGDFSENFRNLGRARLRANLDGDWKLWQKLRKLRQSKKGAPTPDGYDLLAGTITAAADALVGHPQVLEDARQHTLHLISGCQQILAAYAERKRELGVIDYADMIANAERLMRRDRTVLESVLGQIDCVIIDEFQDTNPIQFAMLWRLSRGSARTLLVGDIKQAIMGFQGADTRLTAGLMTAHPDRIEPLERNWRSDARIMDFVNTLGPKLFGEDYMPLTAQRPAGSESALEVLDIEKKGGGKTKAALPQQHAAARIRNLLDDERQWVPDRHTGEPRRLQPRDIAILAWSHSIARRYAAALRTLGIPVRISSDGWYESVVVQAARNALAVAADPSDRHAALCYAVLGPPRMMLEDAVAKLADGRLLDEKMLADLAGVAPVARTLPLPVLLDRVIVETGLRDWVETQMEPQQARADLLRLEALAREFASMHRDMKAAAGFHGSDAKVFLGWLKSRLGERDFDRRPDPSSGSADGVEIVTWHASKGREWPVVLVAGLTSSFKPRAMTMTTRFADFSVPEDAVESAGLRFCPAFDAPETEGRFLAELMPEADATARRLLYVALTRARDKLILEWPAFHLKKEPGDGGVKTYGQLLKWQCGVGPSAGKLTIGDASVPARLIHCSSVVPPEFDEADDRAPARASYGYGRSAIVRQPMRSPGTPWIVTPSSIESGPGAAAPQLQTIDLGEKFEVPGHLFAINTARGTALHQALRVLMQRPDLKGRLAAHTGLDDATLDLVARQANALEAHLRAQGYVTISHEVPVVVQNPDGSTISAIIDCLAEGPEGIAIIDHKSDPIADPDARFPAYWPQLSAYVDVVRRQWPDKTVNRVGIHWMTRGKLTMTCPDGHA